MSNLVYKTTGVAIRLLSKVLSLKFRVFGKENLYDGPTLYVVNHFTRFETLLLPYILYKTSGKQLKTLAKESLFKGGLGKYLSSLGALSRKDPNRNKAIISDLMTGASNWVIYPEGMMVKNKLTIDEKGVMQLKTPYYKGLPRTGAAVMALKAEAIKQLVWKNMRERKLKAARALLKRYGLKVGQLSRKPLRVIPTNITYYPMRFNTKQAKLVFKTIAGKKSLPKAVQEELGVEAALLSNSEVMVSFSKPELPGELVRNSFFGLTRTPLLDQAAMIDYVVNKYRYKLTRTFMREIYSNVFIHADHLLSMLLFKLPNKFVTREQIKYYLFSAITYLFSNSKELHLQKMLTDKKNISALLAPVEDSNNPLIAAIQDFISFAKKNKYLKEENRPIRLRDATKEVRSRKNKKQKVYILQKNKIFEEEKFQSIRVNNPLRVIYNEFLPMFSLIKPLVTAVVNNKLSPYDKVGKAIDFPKVALRFVEEIFRQKRESYSMSPDLKSWDIGRPRFFADATIGENEQLGIGRNGKQHCGIVLCHGYKAAPYEVQALGKFLYNQGDAVFIPRLSGHGTYSKAMQNVSYDDWLQDYLLVTYAMAKKYDKIFLMGFSAGGLLALTTAAREKKIKIAGVVTISTPFVLRNIFFKLPSYINKWNSFCKMIGVGKLSYEFIEQEVEHKDTNYSKNYMHGIAELDKLIEETKQLLGNIKAPLLALQGSDDPVVSSESANIIVSGVSSKAKAAVFLARDNHVIVRGFGNREIFERIDSFVKKYS